MSTKVYHSSAQTKGLNAHKSIDNHYYSDEKQILQGIEVFSEKYNLCGKIDIYNQKSKQLIERKKKISRLYDGFIFQMYAQYFCLTEMGYQVNSLKLYSMDDNKSYPLDLPQNSPEKWLEFEALIDEINQYQLTQRFSANVNKCACCIYSNLCDVALC